MIFVFAPAYNKINIFIHGGVITSGVSEADFMARCLSQLLCCLCALNHPWVILLHVCHLHVWITEMPDYFTTQFITTAFMLFVADLSSVTASGQLLSGFRHFLCWPLRYRHCSNLFCFSSSDHFWRRWKAAVYLLSKWNLLTDGLLWCQLEIKHKPLFYHWFFKIIVWKAQNLSGLYF